VAHLSRRVTGGAFDFGSSSDLKVTYDSLNNVLSESIPLDGTHTATTSYTYNSFGEVLTVTDPLGHVTTNVYDMQGNLTSVTSPAPKLQGDRILVSVIRSRLDEVWLGGDDARRGHIWKCPLGG
jgi:YD repeat-containing protein